MLWHLSLHAMSHSFCAGPLAAQKKVVLLPPAQLLVGNWEGSCNLMWGLNVFSGVSLARNGIVNGDACVTPLPHAQTQRLV